MQPFAGATESPWRPERRINRVMVPKSRFPASHMNLFPARMGAGRAAEPWTPRATGEKVAR